MVRRCRLLLGTLVEVTADREQALEAAFAAIGLVHQLMSAHEPESDVSRINRFAHVGPVKVHEWTMRVLEKASFWSKQSEGAFDIVRAGKWAIEHAMLPTHPGQPAVEAAHWTWLELQGGAVRLHKPGCIDLGGIAKGFAVDRAIFALREAGATRALVNAGGDMAGFGQNWVAQIAEPRERRPVAEVILEDQALATSALVDGLFCHLPGADARFISASVRSRSATDADALTKVLLSGSAVAARCLEAAGAEGLRIAMDGAIEPVECVPA